MAELVDQPHSKCGVLRGVWVRVPPGALDVVHYMKGDTMFNNLPDYKKMEYTSNRLRKEFVAEGRNRRQSDRRGIGGYSLTPWEHLSVDEQDLCSYYSIELRMKIQKWYRGAK